MCTCIYMYGHICTHIFVCICVYMHMYFLVALSKKKKKAKKERAVRILNCQILIPKTITSMKEPEISENWLIAGSGRVYTR